MLLIDLDKGGQNSLYSDIGKSPLHIPLRTHISQTFTAAHSQQDAKPSTLLTLWLQKKILPCELQWTLKEFHWGLLPLPLFNYQSLCHNEPTPAKCMRCRSFLKNISCSGVLVVEHMSPFWLLAALASKQYMSMGSALICRINIPHIIHSIVVQLFYLLWWHCHCRGLKNSK